jgi:hypothetical protein
MGVLRGWLERELHISDIMVGFAQAAQRGRGTRKQGPPACCLAFFWLCT